MNALLADLAVATKIPFCNKFRIIDQRRNAMVKNKYKKWVVYLVRCSDNSLYCGISNDLPGRLKEHNAGKGAKYTKSRRPVELVGTSREMTRSDALKLEYRIKQLPADRKIMKLVKGIGD